MAETTSENVRTMDFNDIMQAINNANEALKSGIVPYDISVFTGQITKAELAAELKEKATVQQKSHDNDPLHGQLDLIACEKFTNGGAESEKLKAEKVELTEKNVKLEEENVRLTEENAKLRIAMTERNETNPVQASTSPAEAAVAVESAVEDLEGSESSGDEEELALGPAVDELNGIRDMVRERLIAGGLPIDMSAKEKTAILSICNDLKGLLGRYSSHLTRYWLIAGLRLPHDDSVQRNYDRRGGPVKDWQSVMKIVDDTLKNKHPNDDPSLLVDLIRLLEPPIRYTDLIIDPAE